MRLLSMVICGSSDLEVNPGPKLICCRSFSVYHWNLNSLPEHDFVKVPLLQVSVTFNKFNVLCQLGTDLDTSVTSNNENLDLSVYNLVRGGHPRNTKKGGDCKYFKDHLPLRLLNI